ncbi:MAG TPA: hypothetical protein VGY54_09215, partial [Polyangiaceae bacterium]|nr:hypothetical protein [Polyangiaceae bacterium]
MTRTIFRFSLCARTVLAAALVSGTPGCVGQAIPVGYDADAGTQTNSSSGTTTSSPTSGSTNGGSSGSTAPSHATSNTSGSSSGTAT